MVGTDTTYREAATHYNLQLYELDYKRHLKEVTESDLNLSSDRFSIDKKPQLVAIRSWAR